jgi:hypothetical protein
MEHEEKPGKSNLAGLTSSEVLLAGTSRRILGPDTKSSLYSYFCYLEGQHSEAG